MLDTIQKRGDRTAFILQAVQEKLAREADEELIAGLMCLVDDPENDISDFAIGQQKVMAELD